MAKDFSERELKIGDEVITISSPPERRHLVQGEIKKLTKQMALIKVYGTKELLKRYQSDLYKVG